MKVVPWGAVVLLSIGLATFTAIEWASRSERPFLPVWLISVAVWLGLGPSFVVIVHAEMSWGLAAVLLAIAFFAASAFFEVRHFLKGRRD